MSKEKLLKEIDELKERLIILESKIKIESNNDKFDFLKWYITLDKNNSIIYTGKNSNTIYRDDCFTYYETSQLARKAIDKRICEYILRKEIEHLNEGWKPEWNNSYNSPHFLYWDNNKRQINVMFDNILQVYPDWMYFPKENREKVLRLEEKLKKQFSKNIVKFVLTEKW